MRHLKYVAGGLISLGLVYLAVMLQSLPDIYQVSHAGGRVGGWRMSELISVSVWATYLSRSRWAGWVGGWMGGWVGGQKGESMT